MGDMKLKLAKAESLSQVQAAKIVELRAALTAAEEPVILQSRHHGFGEGWVAALQAMGVLDDSPLRNPEQIPYPDPTLPPIQNPAEAVEEGDTPSTRALVEAKDSHVELVDLEITSNLDVLPQNAPFSTPGPASQPTEDAPAEQGAHTAPNQPKDSVV